MSGAPSHSDATMLFGRDRDLVILHAFVDQLSSDGDALLLSGVAGVGKTALLDAVAARAADVGLRVLPAGGAEFEAGLSFASLNQVLHPLFDDIEDLSPPQRAALEVALGLSEGPAANPLVLCNAALSLLLQAGSKQPVLVIVDDLQWVDRASALVLGFLARRLHGTRVGFLAASAREMRVSSSAAGCAATTSARSTMQPPRSCWLFGTRRWPLECASVFWRKRRVTRSHSWSFQPR